LVAELYFHHRMNLHPAEPGRWLRRFSF
jgi:hypothetical protein